MNAQRIFEKTFMVLGLSFLVGFLAISFSHAAKLSDLVKKPPQLYLPSQVIPGQTANFTLKGKPGADYKLILSSYSQGAELPGGMQLRVGKATLYKQGKIPQSGVAAIPVEVPANMDLGERQYVEAITWVVPDQQDLEWAQIIQSTGQLAAENIVSVGVPHDPGSAMFLPGDPSVSNVIRSLSTLTEVSGDERKKELLDYGDINRNRQIDRNLNLQSSP